MKRGSKYVIDDKLEHTLHAAFVDARKRRHAEIGVEHLLFWLLTNPECIAVIKGCGSNVEAIRKPLLDLLDDIPGVPGAAEVDTQPTLGFQRVIQRAIISMSRLESQTKK